MLTESAQTPLVAEVVILRVLVLEEFVILLIDRVVRQVHIPVVLVDLLSVGL